MKLNSGQTGTGRNLVVEAHLRPDRDRQNPGKWSSPQGQTGTGRILVSGTHLKTDRGRQDPGKWNSSQDRQGQAVSREPRK